jgi:Fe-S oxidoreductase
MERTPEIIKERKRKSFNIKISEPQSESVTKKFIGDYQNIEALWQCTSCGACMQECPVSIEHVPAIIDMRRSLVMMEANFPQEVQPVYTNLENNFTPWAFSSSTRVEWANDIGVRTASDHPDFDILYWVGCAGSFDERAKKISIAFSKLMQIANVNFAILGNEERCSGDPARRSGNEYLANMLIKANVETLNKYNVKKIVTTCPHCYNTLKNEYPDFGGNYELMHHSQFLKELIKKEQLKLRSYSETHKISYHDSCYLGRYNSEYDAPRFVINSAIGNNNMVEPKRNRDNGFCCGAGGGRMFMEETKGKRVNIERTEELISTGSNEIAVNCPFCMTMITDGVKAKEREDIKVRDIAEILLEQVIQI